MAESSVKLRYETILETLQVLVGTDQSPSAEIAFTRIFDREIQNTEDDLTALKVTKDADAPVSNLE